MQTDIHAQAWVCHKPDSARSGSLTTRQAASSIGRAVDFNPAVFGVRFQLSASTVPLTCQFGNTAMRNCVHFGPGVLVGCSSVQAGLLPGSIDDCGLARTVRGVRARNALIRSISQYGPAITLKAESPLLDRWPGPLRCGGMGWREKRREHIAQLANEYRDESTASWLGGALLTTIVGGVVLGGVLYMLDWAVQDKRDLLRSMSIGVLAALGHPCGRRFLGWWAHRRRTRTRPAPPAPGHSRAGPASGPGGG